MTRRLCLILAALMMVAFVAACEPTPKQSDVDLLDRIYAVLDAHKDLKAHKITIYVENAEVKLIGNVWTWKTRQRVEDLVRGVRGVGRIHNELKVKPPKPVYKPIPRGQIIGGPGSR
jgi:hypothetical protein